MTALVWFLKHCIVSIFSTGIRVLAHICVNAPFLISIIIKPCCLMKKCFKQHQRLKEYSCFTSCIYEACIDRRDPWDFACAGIENNFDISVEHSDALWEGEGETNRDEGTSHHCPTPAPLWRGVNHRTFDSRHCLWLFNGQTPHIQ